MKFQKIYNQIIAISVKVNQWHQAYLGGPWTLPGGSDLHPVLLASELKASSNLHQIP